MKKEIKFDDIMVDKNATVWQRYVAACELAAEIVNPGRINPDMLDLSDLISYLKKIREEFLKV